MMKINNLFGLLKFLFLLGSLIIRIIDPYPNFEEFSLIFLFIVLPVTTFFLSLIVVWMNTKIWSLRLEKAKWNENQFNLSNLVSLFEFLGLFLITSGLGNIIGGAISLSEFNYFGVVMILCGLGFMGGVYIFKK